MTTETFEQATQPPRRPRHIADETFSRWLKVSLGLHGAAIVAMLLKGVVFPGTPKLYAPALRVDMIALPDMLKKDLRNTQPSQGSKEIAEALKRAEADAKSIKPIKIPDQPKAKEPAEVAERDEMVLKPKKVAEKADSKPAEKAKPSRESPTSADRSLKLKGALARIKALDKIRGEEGAAPSQTQGALIKGNRLSKGTSLSGDARESMESGYQDLVRDRLAENWSLPIWLARQNHSARIVLFIDGRGRVRSVRFMKPSGNEQFDSAVKKAIEDSQPFPTPPAEVASSVQVDGIGFAFPL